MAPALVHFLVGASIVLLTAAPLALVSERVRRWRLLLVVAGGFWGLIPDIHNVVPAFRDELRSLHGSRWVDFFALHYTLDRPLVRTLPVESVAASLVWFVVAVFVFEVACYAGRS